MNSSMHKKYSRGLSIVLALFTLSYVLGLAFVLLAWLGVQSFDPLSWPRAALPGYAFVSLLGAAGTYGVWRRKKWGVYCLAATWALTGFVNLVFAPDRPNASIATFAAVLLVIAFFLLLLPAWPTME